VVALVRQQRPGMSGGGTAASAVADNGRALGSELAGIRAHVLAGRLEAAAEACARLRARHPGEAEVLHLAGAIALRRNQTRAAVALLTRAVALECRRAEFLGNAGAALRAAGDAAAAERAYRHALRLAPQLAEIHFNLGNLLREQQRFPEACFRFRQALALHPDKDKFAFNLAQLHFSRGEFEAAVGLYRHTVRLAGEKSLEASLNLGMSCQKTGAYDAALAAYARVLAEQPEHVGAHWNRALVWLVRGRLAEGWAEYEWRWRLPENPPAAFAAPEWDGSQPLAGRTLLVHAEQGLGDTLQFVRYLPELARRGARLILHCQPPLVRLLAACFPEITVAAAEAPPPACDLHAPLLGLPHRLGTRLESIPAAIPYLRAPADPAITGRIRRGPGERAVGLVWGGEPAHAGDAQRSIPLALLEPLRRLPGIRLHSLQKGARAAELAPWLEDGRVVDLGPALTDFADTAAALAELDLVISVDTSVAHLAGALGRPLWLLVPAAPDWRWLLERADSPWYPTARLFRRRFDAGWDEVVAQLAAAWSAGEFQHRRAE
jgi:tetratricopeptide (TPR) repeat protein